MNIRQIPEPEAAPFIASVYAAGEAQLRLAYTRLNRPRAARMGRPPAIEEQVRCPADFGLTAREIGLWGRLRASGLSDTDAADVVKACRREPTP